MDYNPAIRWMIRKDMPEVLRIEEESFDHPWSEQTILDVLRQRNCIAMLIQHKDETTGHNEIAGFMIYELHKTRLHLLDLAIARKHRRKGLGTQLMQKLVGKLSAVRRSSLVVEVCERNMTAQMFFRELGFKAVRVIRGHYEITNEDAYQFVWRIPVEALAD